MTLSDNKILESDLSGPYENGAEGVSIRPFGGMSDIGSDLYSIDLSESSRFVLIRFEDADWKDENLKDMTPRLPSKAYRMTLLIGVREGSIFQVKVGEYQQPFLYLYLFDPDIGLTDLIIRDSMPFGDTENPPEPPLVLYDKGYADFAWEDEDTWVLDVDAWFTDISHPSYTTSPSSFPTGQRYYVRLNFRITINL